MMQEAVAVICGRDITVWRHQHTFTVQLCHCQHWNGRCGTESGWFRFLVGGVWTRRGHLKWILCLFPLFFALVKKKTPWNMFRWFLRKDTKICVKKMYWMLFRLFYITAHNSKCEQWGGLLLLSSPALSLGFTILDEIFAYVTVF